MSGALQAISPHAYAREVRRLRFDDPAVEREFRLDYARRCMFVFRLNFWLGLAIQVPMSVRMVVLDDIGPDDPRFWIRLAVGVIPAVVGLVLSRRESFVPWAERFMLGYVLLIGFVVVALFAPQPLGWTRPMTFLVAGAILPRLRTRMAVVVLATLTAWYAVRAALTLPDPGATLPLGLTSIVTVAAFILFGVVLLEQSARRDFVLARLLEAEQAKSERLLLNVLPRTIADRLKESTEPVADTFADVTVLFADIAGFTPSSQRCGAAETVDLLNRVFSRFDALAEQHGLEKIKTIGDAYLAVGGLPEPRDDHARAVVAMALAMLAEVREFHWPDGTPLELRIGVASGPAVAGVIGTRKFAYDLWGDTVNAASRMESHGVVGRVQLSASTYSHVREVHRATPRQVTVKGLGRVRAYVLDAPDAPAWGSGAPRRGRRRDPRQVRRDGAEARPT